MTPDAHGYDVVMNVVDSVGKWAHFIPTNTTITALGTARLFLHNVWRLHGLPRRIVSDRGPQFVAEFTRELYRLLGITLSTTTAYHPQADRQTERVNQELEQYLQVFVNERQDDWDELLLMADVMAAAALQLLVSDRLPYTDIYLTYNSVLIHYVPWTEPHQRSIITRSCLPRVRFSLV